MPVRNEADPRWDSLKSTIEALYLKNPLEGEEGVMETMARDHEFSKSKSQYESQFKIWGIRKYRKKDDWKSIGRNIAERKRAGKESKVYVNGNLIPKSKVQKETRRHGFITALEQNRPAPIPPIPDGFEIRTPAAEEIVPLTAVPGDTPSLPIETETRVCASSQLQSVSSALTSQTVAKDASLPVRWNAMSSSPSMVQIDLSFVQSQNAITPTIYSPGMYESSGFSFEDVDKYFRPLKLISELPFCQLEDRLLAQIEHSVISTDAQVFGYKLTSQAILLPENNLDVLQKALKGSQSLPEIIKALLPTAVGLSQEEDQVVLSPSHHRSDTPPYKLFSLLIFAMANNFAGLNSAAIDETMDFLSRQASTRLLQHILNTPGPASEAFAEKLFQAAILMEDTRMVKVLLQKGLNPNDLICVHHGVKFTPLEYSSIVRNVGITRLLLDAKSDVNKSVEGENDSGRLIVLAVKGPWWHNHAPRGPVSSELVHMLLEAGGKFDWWRLDCRDLDDNQEAFDLLLDNALKTKTYDQAWEIFVFDHTRKCDNATATRTVSRFLKAGIDIDRDVLVQDKFSRTLNSAAQRGNFELVQMLLSYRVSLTKETLTCAIQSKNKELIRFLLDNRADAVGSDENTYNSWYNDPESPAPAPPLAEAIRWGDAEILDLLEEKGAWSQTVNKPVSPGEFEVVLIAASIRGQLHTVQKLLQFRPPNTHGEDLRNALVAAIYAKEQAIVLTLLDAGANVNGGFYEASDSDAAVREGVDGLSSLEAKMTKSVFWRGRERGPALLEALLQKNEELVRLILDADMNYFQSNQSTTGNRNVTFLEAAVDWGNLSVIKEVILCGVYDQKGALEISVKRKDLECTQLLVNAGVRISSGALRVAVSNNDINMVEYLFSVGAKAADSRALLKAEALPDGLPMFDRLLTEFARRYPQGSFGYGSDTFRKAIREGNFALFKFLLDKEILFRFDIPEWKQGNSSLTLLGEAIEQRHATSLAIFQRLLSEVGNPNTIVQISAAIPYDIKETALLVAINWEDIQKVQMLIDAGADTNWPATKGIKRTPLQKSAEVGSFEITQLLIDQGGLVNNEPAVRGGATALQLAAIGGYIGIAQLLLENDADVNAPAAKFYGRTALEGAAEHGRIDMLKLLWNAGATFQGSEYEKARELAKENGHMATWRYLKTLYPSSAMTSMTISHNW